MKTRVLQQFYYDTEDCLQKMDDKTLALLQKNMGNIKEKIKDRRVQLKRKENYFLVAGKCHKGS